jgi:Transcriptional regulator
MEKYYICRLYQHNTVIYIMQMERGQRTKEKIILEAFKLFAIKPYEKVTFVDIENAVGLSRGAILYHYKTKESIFLAVVRKYIFERVSVDEIYYKDPQICLGAFISAFIDMCKKEKKEMASIGISNVNSAILNIELSAFFVFPELLQEAFEWHYREVRLLKKVVENAIRVGEIRSDFDVEVLLRLFLAVFLGTSFEGMAYPKGYNLDVLDTDFRMLYDFVKK